MTGQELFHALSFVDERYIAEAETARLGSGIPWMKLLSVAACVCILVVGAFALGEFGHKGAMEAAPEAAPQAAPEAAPEAAPAEPEAAPPMPEDSMTEYAAEEPVTVPGELHQIPYARLRVINVWEDGSFEAIVEEISEEPTLFEVGMRVTVVIDPTMIPKPDRTDTVYEENITEDMIVEIRYGTYDAGIGTLYVEGVLPVEIQ